jgi:hypothetical protein
MRVMGSIAVILALGTLPACDRVDEWRAGQRDTGRLVMSLEAPETLDWGGTGTIRLALENQGTTAMDGATIEVHLPSWLEFGSVEPAGTEVVVLAETDGTRLSYRMTTPLEPGERREIVQHVRVPDGGAAPATAAAAPGAPGAPVAVALPGDTVPAAVPGRGPPADRVMRARLLTAGGQETGVEVQAVLAFRGAADAPAVGAPGDQAMVRGDGVAGVRLGMTADELRRTVPGARDTTLTTPGGATERAVLLSLDGNRAITAIISERGVDQILVRDTSFVTERGLGVGSRLGQLRAAYGRECVEPHASGRAAVRFASAPGVGFALSAAMPDTARLRQDPALLPDTARVTELWVRERREPC